MGEPLDPSERPTPPPPPPPIPGGQPQPPEGSWNPEQAPAWHWLASSPFSAPFNSTLPFPRIHTRSCESASRQLLELLELLEDIA